MRPERIVLPSPVLDFPAGVMQAQEPVGVQALVPETAVERLDDAHLPADLADGRAGLDLPQGEGNLLFSVSCSSHADLPGNVFPECARISDSSWDRWRGAGHVPDPSFSRGHVLRVKVTLECEGYAAPSASPGQESNHLNINVSIIYCSRIGIQ